MAGHPFPKQIQGEPAKGQKASGDGKMLTANKRPAIADHASNRTFRAQVPDESAPDLAVKIEPAGRRNALSTAIGVLAATAAAFATPGGASAQTARDVRGPSPFEEVRNQPAPRLIVDPPFQEPLKFGVFQAQYRVENLHIVPVFGAAATQVSPRVGHLHIIVDDLPWWWADAGDNNTVDVANLPPGPHEVTVRLVNANHELFPGQEVVLKFVIPASSPSGHR